jgi:hypothetical protein
MIIKVDRELFHTMMRRLAPDVFARPDISGRHGGDPTLESDQIVKDMAVKLAHATAAGEDMIIVNTAPNPAAATSSLTPSGA